MRARANALLTEIDDLSRASKNYRRKGCASSPKVAVGRDVIRFRALNPRNSSGSRSYGAARRRRSAPVNSYETLASYSLAMIKLATVRIRLGANASTAYFPDPGSGRASEEGNISIIPALSRIRPIR